MASDSAGLGLQTGFGLHPGLAVLEFCERKAKHNTNSSEPRFPVSKTGVVNSALNPGMLDPWEALDKAQWLLFLLLFWFLEVSLSFPPLFQIWSLFGSYKDNMGFSKSDNVKFT